MLLRLLKCFLMVWVFLPDITTAQDSTGMVLPSSGVNAAEYQKIIQKLDYSKTKQKLFPRNSGMPKPKKAEDPRDLPSLSIYQLVAYTLIVFILIFILYTLFGGLKRPENIITIPDSAEEEDINVLSLPVLFEQALAGGDYRSAIRLQFIMVLQVLNQKGYISWHAEKTNRQYLRELSDISLKNTFNELAHIYEWVWYGNTHLLKEDYMIFERKFREFLKTPA